MKEATTLIQNSETMKRLSSNLESQVKDLEFKLKTEIQVNEALRSQLETLRSQPSHGLAPPNQGGAHSHCGHSAPDSNTILSAIQSLQLTVTNLQCQMSALLASGSPCRSSNNFSSHRHSESHHSQPEVVPKPKLATTSCQTDHNDQPAAGTPPILTPPTQKPPTPTPSTPPGKKRRRRMGLNKSNTDATTGTSITGTPTTGTPVTGAPNARMPSATITSLPSVWRWIDHVHSYPTAIPPPHLGRTEILGSPPPTTHTPRDVSSRPHTSTARSQQNPPDSATRAPAHNSYQILPVPAPRAPPTNDRQNLQDTSLRAPVSTNHQNPPEEAAPRTPTITTQQNLPDVAPKTSPLSSPTEAPAALLINRPSYTSTTATQDAAATSQPMETPPKNPSEPVPTPTAWVRINPPPSTLSNTTTDTPPNTSATQKKPPNTSAPKPALPDRTAVGTSKEPPGGRHE